MVVTDLNGQLLETNALKPSSDLPTHLYLYQKCQKLERLRTRTPE